MNRKKHKLRKIKERRKKNPIQIKTNYSGTAVIFRGSSILPIYDIAMNFKIPRNSLTMVTRHSSFSGEDKLKHVSKREKITFDPSKKKPSYLSFTEVVSCDDDIGVVGYNREVILDMMNENKGVILFAEKESYINIHQFFRKYKYRIITVDINPNPAEIAMIISTKLEKINGRKNSRNEFIEVFNQIELDLEQEKTEKKYPSKIELKSVFLRKASGVWGTIDAFQEEYIFQEKEEADRKEQDNPLYDIIQKYKRNLDDK